MCIRYRHHAGAVHRPHIYRRHLPDRPHADWRREARRVGLRDLVRRQCRPRRHSAAPSCRPRPTSSPRWRTTGSDACSWRWRRNMRCRSTRARSTSPRCRSSCRMTASAPSCAAATPPTSARFRSSISPAAASASRRRATSPDATLAYARRCRAAGILTSLDGGGLRSNTNELLGFIDVAMVAERLC